MLRVTLYEVQLTSSFRQNDISSLKLKSEPSQVRETMTREEGRFELSNLVTVPITTGSQISLFVPPLCSLML